MKIKAIILLVCCSAIGCEKQEKTYTGDTKIEFCNNQSYETIPFNTTTNHVIKSKIQIVGHSFYEDKRVIVLIQDPKSYIVSNTVETLISTNSYSCDCEIQLNASMIPQGFTDTITLFISEESDVNLSKNYSQATIIIHKQSFHELFIGSFTCEESSTNTSYKTTFSFEGNNTIKNNNFWNFSPQNQFVTYTINNDTNQTISIKEQFWTDKMGITYKVYGNGFYDFSGKMTVNYTMIENNSDTLYEIGSHIFIPIKQ